MFPRHRLPLASSKSQRGAAIVLIVVAMAALLLMAGLALDGGHMMLDKTRLQNAVDAAALSAAKTLDQTGNTDLATAQAVQAFANNANSSGNQELSKAYASGSGEISLTIQYSATLPPFTPGSATGPYVRVTATGFNLLMGLARLSGISQASLSATAVAGPSPAVNNACNIAPMVVCGDSAAGAANLWGYTKDAPTVLKASAPGNSSEIGPGNFQLIQLGGTGANIVRQNLAGGYTGCTTTGNTVTTETGNNTGPTAQGINTRFGDYSGPMHGTQNQYPPDVIVTGQSPALTVSTSGTTNTIKQGSTTITASNINILYNYQKYSADLQTPAKYSYQPVQNGGIGAFQRRVLALPVGSCTGTGTGKTSVPVLGFACFFLLQPVVQKGTNAYVLGQFIDKCDVNGTPGPSPASGTSPYIIQLYHDPDSGDS